MREPTLLAGRDEDVARWVAERIPSLHGLAFGPCVAFGVGDEARGKLYAGVVFHDHQPAYRHVQLSMAAVSPLWATRRIIGALLSVPFDRLKVWMVWTLTPIENVKAIKVNEHIGFKRKPIVPHAYGQKRHGVIYQMTAPEYARLYGG